MNLSSMHPDLLEADSKLQAWLSAGKQKPLEICEGLRTLSENREKNLAEYKMQVMEHREAPWRLVDEINKQRRAEELSKLSEQELIQRATRRFSWHMVGCALSYSLVGLEKRAVDEITAWLRKEFTPPKFQVLVSEGCYFRAGTPFIRLERHDFFRRNVNDPRKEAGLRMVALSTAA